jgi:hypothetical protein
VEAHLAHQPILRGWNPIRVAQATVVLLPLAIALGGAATRVVLPVAVICALGVVRRERVLRAPTDVQRQAMERAGRVPKAAQGMLMAYTLVGFAAIYHFIAGPPRVGALVAQILIVLAASSWLRSLFNSADGPAQAETPVQADTPALADTPVLTNMPVLAPSVRTGRSAHPVHPAWPDAG